MRNLKKVLSLSLALVMLLGMMIVGAGAAAYTDTADTTKEEAIEVMSAVKVIAGDGTGNFNPDGTLSRAEAAIIIARVVLTPDVVSKLGAVDCQFTDMAPYPWATAAVQACANEGIIDGYNPTTFGPADKVTEVQFAKMLLVALGFDGAKYTGATWELNTRQDAIKAGLDANGVTITNTPLKREDAAQMAFNAVTKYSPSGSNGYVLMDGDNLAAAYADVVFPSLNDAVLAKLASGGGASAWSIKEVVASDTLAATRFNLTQGTTVDGFGRTVKTWLLAGVEDPVYVSDESLTAPVKVYTAGTLPATVANDLGTYDFTGLKKANVLTNGATEDGVAANAATVSAAITGTADLAGLTRNGKIIEVYADNAKNIIKVVIIEKEFAKLASDPVIASDGKVTIASVGMAGVKPENVDGNVAALAKDDVVLVVKDADDVWHIEKAECVTGAVSGNHNLFGALIGGKYYTASGLTAKGGLSPYTNASITNSREYNFYLDNYGYIMYSEPVTGAVVSNYAVVLETSWVLGSPTGNLNDDTSSHLQARILKTDGTTEVVRVASVNGFIPVALPETATTQGLKDALLATTATHAIVETGDFAAPAAGASATAVGSTAIANGDTVILLKAATYATTDVVNKYMVITDMASTSAARVTNHNFYSFTVNASGAYALSSSALTGDSIGTVTASSDITPNAVEYNAAGNGIGSADTVFLYAVTTGTGTAAKTEYKAYTGIGSIPKVEAANLTAGHKITNTTSGVDKFVYVQADATVTNTTEVVYITNILRTQLNTNPATYIYSALVNGVPQTITTDTDYGFGAVGFYSVTNVDEKGVYTLNSESPVTAIISVTGNTLVTNSASPAAIAYDTGAIAWYYDGVTSAQTTVEALTPDATDLVYVVKDATNTKAVAVYVIAVDAQPTSLVVAESSTSNVGISNTSVAAPTSGDIRLGTVTLANASGQNAVGSTITITATNSGAAGMSYKVGIDGAGIDVDVTALGATNVATYDLVAGDAEKDLKVTVLATDTYSKAVYTYTYTVKVDAITAAGGSGSSTPSAGDAAVTVAITGTTATATFNAGTSGLTASSYKWISSDTDKATIAGTTATATITDVVAGDTNITVEVTLSNGAKITSTAVKYTAS